MNNAGIYSQQPQTQGYPQQRPSFGKYLGPTQVQHGGGARLSPMAVYKLAME